MGTSLIPLVPISRDQSITHKVSIPSPIQNSSFKGNNYNSLSRSRKSFNGLPIPFADSSSVARVQPRTSKGITDLLSLNLVRSKPDLYIWTLFISQIAPPTKNGHAPPTTKSRKSFQSVNPNGVRFSPARLHSWWCPSVNFFKFQLSLHTPLDR
uniref:Ovule protein n=1 Tax=Heterorhabditis bacteriophora TaxID=37862 RepID=A0A1I7WD87_HETBA